MASTEADQWEAAVSSERTSLGSTMLSNLSRRRRGLFSFLSSEIFVQLGSVERHVCLYGSTHTQQFPLADLHRCSGPSVLPPLPRNHKLCDHRARRTWVCVCTGCGMPCLHQRCFQPADEFFAGSFTSINLPPLLMCWCTPTAAIVFTTLAWNPPLNSRVPQPALA